MLIIDDCITSEGVGLNSIALPALDKEEALQWFNEAFKGRLSGDDVTANKKFGALLLPTLTGQALKLFDLDIKDIK